MLIQYIEKRFNGSAREWIDKANVIIGEYEAEGLTLTLRQLFYQFVARGLAPNSERTYAKLSRVVSDARLAGLISWEAIEDRTRFLRENGHWDNPANILDGAARSFQLDKWATQNTRVEVWIEKDALLGVIDRLCQRLDVPYFSCRGYTSQSEQWRAGQRLQAYREAGQTPVILHLGDHDPSGLDMTRDNNARLDLFYGEPVEVRRLALNYKQVKQYNPPPNPTKLTDSRTGKYTAKFGESCWELDALDPKVLAKLVEREVDKLRDDKEWDKMVEQETQHKADLTKLSDKYPKVVKYLAKLK